MSTGGGAGGVSETVGETGGSTPAGSGGGAGTISASAGKADAGGLAGAGGSASDAKSGGKATASGGAAGTIVASAGKAGGSASARPGGTGGAVTSGAGTAGTTSASGGTSTSGSDTSAELVNPRPGSKFFVGANFWRIDWEGATDFFLPNVDWATVTNPWQPQLLADLAPYHVLRFMDWNLANSDPNPQAVWETRKQKTDKQTAEPIAFEWQIDLCNRTLKDCWFAVPIQGDASYQQKLAKLVLELLDPRLRVYVEYANEVWNGSFPQAAINAANADKYKVPVEPNSCCETADIKEYSAYVYGAVRLFEQFESVFGKNSPRLVKVLSGQAAWDGPCKSHMNALQNKVINPNGTMPTAYAIAPYFAGTSIAELRKSITDVVKWTTVNVACAAKYQLPVIAYEGGSDSYAASGNGCTTLMHDSGMHDLYMSYFDTQAAAGILGPFNQYTHTGRCWGLKEKTSDALSVSPKYQGVLDWLKAHP